MSENLLSMSIYVDPDTDSDLSVCVGGDADDMDGIIDQPEENFDIYLFDNCFQNYFWNYDNNGLKNLELRFYKD